MEHFRPKAAYSQDSGDALHTPGYYWLAYEWNNLFLACQLCNQQFKKNLFPLANPFARATSHKEEVAKESPLFIDPSADDPEQFISFRGEVPFALDGNPRGETTIRELGLDRLKLNERRLERYELLKKLYQLSQLRPPLPESDEAKTKLIELTQDAAEYASMARAAIRAQFKLL